MAQLIKVANWPGTPRGHVIFVHGLGGHAYETWKQRESDETFWPSWLARDVEGLTVWTLSYSAPATNWLGTAPPLQDRAVTVLELLLSRPELKNAPIAFVCHSLGGLVVKQMLRAANDQRDDRPAACALLDQVKAIVFIATPHIGSAHASWLDWFRLVLWPSNAAQDLVRNDANLRNLNVWYRNWSDKIANRIFYETQGTAVGTIVDPGSADAGLPGAVPIGIDADHVRICKPSSEDGLLYRSTRDFLANDVFARPKGRRRKSKGTSQAAALPSLSVPRSKTWAPIALRLAVLLFIVFLGFQGIRHTFFPGDPLAAATVQQIEQALRAKHPKLTPEQIERFMSSLQEARGDPTFKKAVEEAKKGNTRVAEGIWKQIYEDRKRQQRDARKEQAEAARKLAAVAVIENAKEGLAWYREATVLDPQNKEGWKGLGDAALAGGTVQEALHAYRKYIAVAQNADDEEAVAVGHSSLGNALTVAGNIRESLEALAISLGKFKSLAASRPDDLDLHHKLALSHGMLGTALSIQGKAEQALQKLQSAVSVQKRVVEADPDNINFQGSLWTFKAAIAGVHRTQGKLKEASRSFEASYETIKRLAYAEPTNLTWQYGLAWNRMQACGVSAELNLMTDALESCKVALAVATKQSEERPNSIQWHQVLALANQNLANTYYGQGNSLEALSSANAARKSYRRVAELDRKNFYAAAGLASIEELIGNLLFEQSDYTGALDSYRASLAIAQRFAENKIANTVQSINWEVAISLKHQQIGDVHKARGDSLGALESYRRSLAIRKRLAEMDPNNAAWQRNLATIHRRLALNGGDPLKHWQNVVDILKKLDTRGQLQDSDRAIIDEAEHAIAAKQRS